MAGPHVVPISPVWMLKTLIIPVLVSGNHPQTAAGSLVIF